MNGRNHEHGTSGRNQPVWHSAAWLAVLLVGLTWSAGEARGLTDEAAGEQARPGAREADEGAVEMQRMGRMMTLSLPITSSSVGRARRFVSQAMETAAAAGHRPVLVFRFEVPRDQDDFGRGTRFSAAYELADLLSGPELNVATTVAYVPQSIQGHAVLAVIACDEIIMAEGAQIGAAGIDEQTITETHRSAYREIANRRRTVPVVLALSMLDAALTVLRVETEVATEFVTPEGLEKIRQERAIKAVDESEPVVRAGEFGQFTGSQARLTLNFVRHLAETREEVSRALGLPPHALEEDPSLGGVWRAVRVSVRGQITSDMVTRTERVIEEAIREREINFLCVVVQSSGGAPAESLRLASFLAALKPGEIRTVAYVPVEARGDAALIALACDQLVMHRNAVLGGYGAYAFSEADIATSRVAVQDIAARKGRNWSLPVAVFDPELEVHRFVHAEQPGLEEFFSEEELAEQPRAEDWRRQEMVVERGSVLEVDGGRAVDLQLARDAVESMAQFRQLYDLEDDPELVEPGWTDYLIDTLRRPGLAFLLLLIGGVALYIELQSPGIGVGAFIAAVCFLIFFWSRFGLTAEWLEILLFIAGVTFILIEIFVVPGFGIFGLGGGALVLASLILAGQPFFFPRNPYQLAQLQQSLLVVAGSLIGILVVIAGLQRWLPKAPVLGHMFLAPPTEEEAEELIHRESLADYAHLVGAQGITATLLAPSGKARFGEETLDVIADGELIDCGEAVEIVEVRGNRILVQRSQGDR